MDGARAGDGALLDAVVAPIQDVALVRNDETGDVTVLSLGDTECKPLVLSGTAAVIWDELDGVRSLRLIVQELAAEFGLDEPVIREHVLTFVTQLLAIELLQTRDAADASA